MIALPYVGNFLRFSISNENCEKNIKNVKKNNTSLKKGTWKI